MDLASARGDWTRLGGGCHEVAAPRLHFGRKNPILGPSVSNLTIFNSLTRSTEAFVPLDPGGRKVGMYCCGPTVYDFGHIGNFRTFVFADLVRRYLEFKGLNVNHVMNITDVEDKIIRRVRETGKSLPEFTQVYERAFLEDMEVLNCRRPHQMPRATSYIEDRKSTRLNSSH